MKLTPFYAAAVLVATCLHGWAGAAAPAPGGAAPGKPRPNVLFIAIDDLNDWGVTALNGRKGVHTPNLDRLAARGMLFLNANCAAPACNPSRTSVLTGIAPYSSGVYNNSSDWRVNERLKPVTTLPNYFRQHGYAAYGAGKLFHSLEWHDGPTDGYNDPGSWDTYFPSFQRQMPHRVLPPDTPLARGTGTRPPNFFDWGPIQKPMESMPDHQVIDWSIAELGKKHDKPFFQAVGIFRPHIPWYVPQQFFDLYPLDQIELPYVKPGWREKLPPAGQRSGQVRRQWHQWVLNNHQWTNAVQGYLASISFADYQLGRLLDALDRSPEKDNTIVMLWTDHGFHLGNKDTWEKFTLWAESTRVPLIVVAPGVTRPGSQCARAVSLLDMYPTLVELAGLPPCEKNQGMSLVPWLRDPARPKERPAVVTNGRGNHAVRDDRWHYIRYAGGDEELYDMAGDAGQWDNLAADPKYADIKARLAQWLPKEDAPDQGPTRGGLEGPPLAQGDALRMGGDGAVPAVPGKPAALSQLKLGDKLGRNESPDIANKPFRVSLEIMPQSREGVVVAQGGAINGWALWLHEGRLRFTVRVSGQATTIEAKDTPAGRLAIEASLAADGGMALTIDGHSAASGRAAGLIPVRPRDGLSVGFSSRSTVGDYDAASRFSGTLTNLSVRIEP